MDALVTGGTGFVGANVVRELLRDGREVRVLARAGGDRRALDGLRGRDRGRRSPRPRLAATRRRRRARPSITWPPTIGCGRRDPAVLYRTNVDGTRAVLEAAAAGRRRAASCTPRASARSAFPRTARPGTEDDAGDASPTWSGRYKRSKFLAEQVALEFARRGLPVVIVNPSAPIGPWDVKPTPTGQMVVDFMRGRMFATLDTGLNLVHVRDVARGHLLAAERGRLGERYILGYREPPAGRDRRDPGRDHRAARRRACGCPYAVAWLGAACSRAVSRVTGRAAGVPLTAVRMARKRMYFSPAKAVRELGLPQTDVREALRDAVAWFDEHGYARSRGAASA